jgi:hypothetical protein
MRELPYNTGTDPKHLPRRKTTNNRPWKRFVNKMFIHWMAAIGGNVARGGNHENVRVWHAKERTTGYFANVSQLICNCSWKSKVASYVPPNLFWFYCDKLQNCRTAADSQVYCPSPDRVSCITNFSMEVRHIVSNFSMEVRQCATNFSREVCHDESQTSAWQSATTRYKLQRGNHLLISVNN